MLKERKYISQLPVAAKLFPCSLSEICEMVVKIGSEVIGPLFLFFFSSFSLLFLFFFSSFFYTVQLDTGIKITALSPKLPKYLQRSIIRLYRVSPWQRLDCKLASEIGDELADGLADDWLLKTAVGMVALVSGAIVNNASVASRNASINTVIKRGAISPQTERSPGLPFFAALAKLIKKIFLLL